MTTPVLLTAGAASATLFEPVLERLAATLARAERHRFPTPVLQLFVVNADGTDPSLLSALARRPSCSRRGHHPPEQADDPLCIRRPVRDALRRIMVRFERERRRDVELT